MFKLSLAAGAAAVMLASGPAFALPPPGSDVLTNHPTYGFDFLLFLPSNATFSLFLDYDASLMTDLGGIAGFKYSNFYGVPPSTWYPDGWQQESGLDVDVAFDPLGHAVIRDWGAPVRTADIHATPTGLEFDFFGGQDYCQPRGDRDHCSEIDGARYIGLYGFLPEGVSTPISWRYSEVVPLGSVPEPGVWAMMIAGFALVGVAMRRRATAVAA